MSRFISPSLAYTNTSTCHESKQLNIFVIIASLVDSSAPGARKEEHITYVHRQGAML